jgi:hypothetical protein
MGVGEARPCFFEKKKLETFANCGRRLVQHGSTGAAETGKNFLLLFFKKEGLSPVPSSS